VDCVRVHVFRSVERYNRFERLGRPPKVLEMT
jgi:hypothetical protein